MSDFINFKDEVLSGNPQYYVGNDSAPKQISLATPVTEEGTKLNKSFFNKLNAVLGYNEVIGTYNYENEKVEFETDIDTSNFENNQRLLVQCMNRPTGPADDVEILKQGLSGSLFEELSTLKMSNGNIMVVSSASGNNHELVILDQSANIIKDDTSVVIYRNTKLIEMSDGNIMIVSSYTGNSNTYMTIIDKNANIIKSSTSLGADLFFANLLEMNNGNIIIAGSASNTAKTLNIVILNKNGDVVKSRTEVGSGSYMPKLIKTNDGNIMIVGHVEGQSNLTGYLTIVDQTGNVIKSSTQIGNYFYNKQLMKMSNGNIMIASDNNVRDGYITIVDSSGEIVKSTTQIGYFPNPQLIEMSNGNIMVTGDGHIIILDQDGNTIKTETAISSYLNYPQLIQMSNGNIFILGDKTTGGQQYFAIVDENGDVLISKQITTITENGLTFAKTNLIETDDSNIFVTGSKGSSVPYSLVYLLLEPFISHTTSTMNNILLDTTLLKDKYYELVYNETQDKFICEEVRNGNS